MVLCFFGDSLTLGYGDEAALGWPGRIIAAMKGQGVDTTAYNLGIRGETGPSLQHRWRGEAMLRRMPEQEIQCVFSFGVADVKRGVQSEMSLAAGVSILTQAKEIGKVLVVGPLPVNDVTVREEVTTLSRMQAGLCKRLDIPFIPTIDAMHRSFVYGQSLNDGDGIHPTASGYADLADHILKFNTAREFFGLE